MLSSNEQTGNGNDAQPEDPLLISFALLEAQRELQGDSSILDHFVPFIASIVVDARPDPVPYAEVIERLLERFSLEIPWSVVLSATRRGARQGYLVRADYAVSEGPRIGELGGFEEIRQEALRRFSVVRRLLKEFFQKTFGEFLSNRRAEALLDELIMSRTLPLIRIVDGVQAGKSPSQETARLVADYQMGAFITHLYEREPQSFGFLAELVKGAAVASAVYLPGMAELPASRADGVAIYIDTPILLDLLGFRYEPHRETAARELLVLMTDVGAIPSAFRHSVAEVRGILAQTLEDMSSAKNGIYVYDEPFPGRMSLTRNLIENNVSPQTLRLRLERIEDDLRAMDVSIDGALEFSDEVRSDLDAALESIMPSQSREARANDVASLEGVHTLRRGEVKDRFDRCDAVFVSRNDELVAASRAYFGEPIDGYKVPTAALLSEMTTVLWLKKPAERPDITTKQLIADSAAASYPNERLWRRFVDLLNDAERAGRMTRDEVIYLRFGPDAWSSVMRETQGDPNKISIATVQRVRTELLSQDHSKRDVEALTKRIAQLEAQAGESDISRIDELEAQISHLTNELLQSPRFTVSSTETATFRRGIAVTASRWLFHTVVAAVALPILILATLELFVDVFQAPWDVIVICASLALVALGVASAFFGSSLRSLLRPIERRFAEYLDRKLREATEDAEKGSQPES